MFRLPSLSGKRSSMHLTFYRYKPVFCFTTRFLPNGLRIKHLVILAGIVLLLHSFQPIPAQTVVKPVTGRILGVGNQPLDGASISVKGGGKSTVSDKDGRYSISVSGTATLVYSFISYTTKQEAINNRTEINVTLQPEVKEADEVVVIGYQTVRRRDVLASVSSISAKDLKDVPINSAAEALAGRLAGVQVTTAEGSPGADVKIRVRGGGSITQDNSPLYIIDGVQVENGLSTLSPQDIQSIDVLKDAAATAIYGARGANGVIIITTKSGRPGRITVNYNGNFGSKRITKTLNVLSPYDMVMFEYERTRANTTDSANFAKTYGTTFDTLKNYKNMPMVDWQREIMGMHGFSQTHNISVGGGNKNTTFNLSYTNNNDKAIVINSGYNRNLLNFKLDHNVGSKVKMGFSARYIDQEVYGAGVSDDKGSAYNRLRNSVKYRPFLLDGIGIDQIDPSLADPVGNGLNLVNPIILANEEYRKKSTVALNLTGYINYTIVKNLTFKSTFGIDNNTVTDRMFSDTITPYSKISGSSKPIAELDTTNRLTFTNSNVLTYSLHDIGKKHDIDVLLGEETYRVNTKTATNIWGGYPVGTTVDQAFSQSPTGKYFTGYPRVVKSEFTSLSYFGRLSYAYDKKYLLSFNMRADGSSKFAPDVRWGYFPSASAAWRISREKFMRNNNFFNDLKLRVGYGEVGNNRIDDYLYLTTFNTNVYYGLNGQATGGYLPVSLVNELLKWETTVNKNVGLDVAVLHNRIQLSVDYYQNTTKDLLLNVPTPTTSGYTVQLQNIGATTNKGVEFQLNANIIRSKSFTWNASFNISFNTNTIDALGRSQSSFLQSAGWGVSGQPADYIVKVGQSVGAMYGLVTDGFYKVDDFDYNAATKTYTLKAGVPTDASIIGTPQPGSIRFKDLNGDGKIDLDNDRTIIGNASPKYTGGFNQQFTYKGFDMSIFFNFVQGNSIYNANKIEFSNAYTPNSNVIADMAGRFRTVNDQGQVVTDPNELKTLNANATMWKPIAGAGAFYPHSWAIEDGSFLRLNNLSIGYTLPVKIVDKLHIQRLRIYATGNNLALFTKYTGYDPEVNVRSNPTTPGLDYSAYPKSRSYVFGVNVTF